MSAVPLPGRFLLTMLLALAALTAALVGETIGAHARAEAARIGGAVTVQVLAPQDAAGLARASEALRRTRGVMHAAPMGALRAAQLLQGRGAGVDPADLPPLHLIEVSRAPEATDALIAQALRNAGVRAELYSTEAPGPARTARIAAVAGPGAALLLLFGLLLTHAAGRRLDAGLAADLGTPRGAVLAAHGRIGASAGFAAGLTAAVIATFGAAGVLLWAGDPLSWPDMLTRLSAPEIALVLLAPLASAGAATLGARMGAARAFDAADRFA